MARPMIQSDTHGEEVGQKVRLQNCYAEIQRGSWGHAPSGEGVEVACIRVGDFDRERLRLKDQPRVRRVPREARNADERIPLGAHLIELAGGHRTRAVGAVVEYTRDENAMCSNYVAYLEPYPAFDADYLLYRHLHLLQSGQTRAHAHLFGDIWNLDLAGYLKTTLRMPTKATQEHIGRELRALHERTIALRELREKQRALVWERWERVCWDALLPQHGGATSPRALDRSDQLPQDWTMRRLSHVVDVQAGAVLRAEDFGTEGVPIIQLSDVREEGVDVASCKRVDPDLVDARAWAVRGDMVVALSGRFGVACRVNQERVAVNQRVAILHARGEGLHNGDMDPYLTAFIGSPLFRTQLALENATDQAIVNVSMPSLRHVRVPWPPAKLRARMAHDLSVYRQATRALDECFTRARELQWARFGAMLHEKMVTDRP